MNWKWLLRCLAGTAGLIFLLVIVNVPTLVLTSGQGIEKVYMYEEKKELTIRWIHSVEKEAWEEMFVLENKEIELTGTRFKTFGAGVPSDTGENTYIKDGWVYMTDISQNIGKNLSLRTGEYTDHVLTYGKDTKFELEKKRGYQLIIKNSSILSISRFYILEKLRGE